MKEPITRDALSAAIDAVDDDIWADEASWQALQVTTNEFIRNYRNEHGELDAYAAVKLAGFWIKVGRWMERHGANVGAPLAAPAEDAEKRP